VHFGDDHLVREIVKELDPKKQKAMGRCVAGFTDEEWDKGMLETVIKRRVAVAEGGTSRGTEC